MVGLFPANAVGDDVELYADESRDAGAAARSISCASRRASPPGQPHECLADYVAPKASGVRDYFGAFAVTAGIGIEQHVARFEREHDDYSAIMLKALADRFAEAAAEHFHERVRRELWGYAADETLTNEQLVREEYRGIRPAPGYPACPDHTEKRKLWELLDVERNAGIRLTDSYAMYPTAAVSGWYIGHPQSRYFARRQDRPRPGAGLRPPQGDERSPRRSAGSRPTSATTPEGHARALSAPRAAPLSSARRYAAPPRPRICAEDPVAPLQHVARGPVGLQLHRVRQHGRQQRRLARN